MKAPAPPARRRGPWSCLVLVGALALGAPLRSQESGPASPGAEPNPADPGLREAEAAVAAGDGIAAMRAYRRALAALLPLAAADDGARRWLPEAEAALRRLGDLAREFGDHPENRAAFEGWARPPETATPAPAGTPEADILASARWAATFIARLEASQRQPLAGARESWRALGFLTGWRVAGPFANERGGGFNEDFGPETPGKLRLDAVYVGKRHPARWRELPAEPVAGRVDLRGLFHPAEEVLAYAWTHVRAGEAADAALRFGTNDGFRVWVNGALVASGDVHRPFAHDQNAVRLRLARGWNSILFKVTQAQGGWELAARLTRPDGAPLAGVTEGWPEAAAEQEVEAPAPAGAADKAAPCPGGNEELLGQRLAADPADARAHYLLGVLLLGKRAHDSGDHPDTDMLGKAISLDDAPAIYHLDLARSQERETAIAAQRDDNAWRRSLEAAAERRSARAALLLAAHALDTFGNVRRARALAAAALEKNPALEAAVLLRGRIEASLGFPRAREKVFAALPAAPATLATRLEKARFLSERGRREESAALLGETLAANPRSGEAREALAGALLAGDRAEEAEALLRQGAALAPFDTVWRLELAALLDGRDRLEEALAEVEAALRIRPEDEGLEEKRAGFLLRLGKREEALASFGRVLELQPSSPRVRERLEYLREGGAPPAGPQAGVRQFRRDAAELAREAWKTKTEPGDSQEPARLLLDLTVVEVHRDGTAREYVQKVVQVLNDLGIRNYDSFATVYAPGEQFLEFTAARVLRPDGGVEEARLARFGREAAAGREEAETGGYARAAVDLPVLSSGDVIEIEYVREDVAQGFFGDYFGRQEVFQESVPVLEKVFILEVPADRKFYFHQSRLDLKPREERGGAPAAGAAETGTVRYTWTARDLPKLDPEPAMPPVTEVAPVLEVSTFASWDEFRAWYWNLIKKQFESSPEIARKVRELTSGASDAMARVRAIYNFIVTDIRYNAWPFGVHGFKPYNAATIFARRFGDCKDKATLMSVMLREAGVAAYPVLIRSDPARGAEDLTLPIVNHFNHCISYVPAAGGVPELYLDGTAEHHALEELPFSDRGARVLLVMEPGGGLAETPWNAPEEIAAVEEAVTAVRPDLGGTMEIKARCRGEYAAHVRASFEIAAERKTNLERIFAARHAGARVTAESFSNLADLEAPVHAAASVDVPRLVFEAPGGLTLEPPRGIFDAAANLIFLGSLEKRRYDVILGSPRRSRLEASIVLPDGLKVKSLPPPRETVSRFGRLRVAYSLGVDGKLACVREVEISAPRVGTAEYPEFREFAASLKRLEDEKIILERVQ